MSPFKNLNVTFFYLSSVFWFRILIDALGCLFVELQLKLKQIYKYKYEYITSGKTEIHIFKTIIIMYIALSLINTITYWFRVNTSVQWEKERLNTTHIDSTRWTICKRKKNARALFSPLLTLIYIMSYIFFIQNGFFPNVRTTLKSLNTIRYPESLTVWFSYYTMIHTFSVNHSVDYDGNARPSAVQTDHSVMWYSSGQCSIRDC